MSSRRKDPKERQDLVQQRPAWLEELSSSDISSASSGHYDEDSEESNWREINESTTSIKRKQEECQGSWMLEPIIREQQGNERSFRSGRGSSSDSAQVSKTTLASLQSHTGWDTDGGSFADRRRHFIKVDASSASSSSIDDEENESSRALRNSIISSSPAELDSGSDFRKSIDRINQVPCCPSNRCLRAEAEYASSSSDDYPDSETSSFEFVRDGTCSSIKRAEGYYLFHQQEVLAEIPSPTSDECNNRSSEEDEQGNERHAEVMLVGSDDEKGGYCPLEGKSELLQQSSGGKSGEEDEEELTPVAIKAGTK